MSKRKCWRWRRDPQPRRMGETVCGLSISRTCPAIEFPDRHSTNRPYHGPTNPRHRLSAHRLRLALNPFANRSEHTDSQSRDLTANPDGQGGCDRAKTRRAGGKVSPMMTELQEQAES